MNARIVRPASRRSSPRPTFDGPTAIAYEAAARHLWGDETAGYVADRIYVSSDRIHQIELALPPGARFQHSDENRTIFAADEVYHVIEGELVVANPETGEVVRAVEGDSIFFRRDTWHHGFNRSSSRPARAIELFAPPPATGASSAYARTRPNLTDWTYRQDDLLGGWPSRDGHRPDATLRVLRDEDLLWRLEDVAGELLVGLVCSTANLTVGKASLLRGRRSEPERHAGDESLTVLRGRLGVFLPEMDGTGSWMELDPGDGCYIPQGWLHQYLAPIDDVTFLFGVAPTYLQRPNVD